MKRTILTTLIALTLSASAHAQTMLPLDPGSGWWIWCETDPYTGVTVCTCVRGTSDNGKGKKKGSRPVKKGAQR